MNNADTPGGAPAYRVVVDGRRTSTPWRVYPTLGQANAAASRLRTLLVGSDVRVEQVLGGLHAGKTHQINGPSGAID